jgi:hypothetical protein
MTIVTAPDKAVLKTDDGEYEFASTKEMKRETWEL